jgi:AraC family transcriptional regulator
MENVAPVTQGSINATAELGAFRLTETSHMPNTILAAHQHSHAAITFVLQGAFTERFDTARDISCAAMTVLRKPAGAAHSNQYSKVGARSFILECLTTSPLYDGLRACTPQVGLTRAIPRMLELYSAFRSETPERLTLAEEIALEISHEASSARSTTRRPIWLTRVAERVEQSSPHVVSLTVLAADVAVHPVYLARAFRRHYGQSVGAYSLQCRIRFAAARLATSDGPISRIAQDCGFADQAHFTRLFSREVGESPARFRRLLTASRRLLG